MNSREYWGLSMRRRMPMDDELTRLESILYGFLYRHNSYAVQNNLSSEVMTLSEFINSKRPYGNKDIASSIAFNLGWDNERRLTTEEIPRSVEYQAMNLHYALKKKIESEYSNI
ncbi:hypothetical protein QO179_23620 [Bacillus stercoris]|nr:hypothetical protein [Bacillus stercoris]